jgi:hypothetical protein
VLPAFEEEADDLDALDAMVGPAVEEIDAWHDADAIDVDVAAEEEPRRSAPPPPPAARYSAPASRQSAPPPLPSTRTTGSGEQRAPSIPPPLPKRER